MIKVKFKDGWKYYEAMAWCMTYLDIRHWKPDAFTQEIFFANSKDALIVAMRFT